MPVVEGYTYELKDSGIRCDIDNLAELVVNNEPTEVYLAITRGYEEEGKEVQSSDFIKQDRQIFYENTRYQQVVFKLAQMITDDLVQGARSGEKALLARHQIFPEIVQILYRYIERRVRFAPGVDPRELALNKYAQLIRERVRDGILPAAASREAPLLPVVNSFQEKVGTAGVDYQTARPTLPLSKSELNAAAIFSWGSDVGIGEATAIDALEDIDMVEAFSANDRRIGFEIPYDYQGAPHRYQPDFIVRLWGGIHVVLEIKGRKGELHGEDQVEAKNAGAKKWVNAVNNSNRYGRWAYEICYDLRQLREKLAAHSSIPGQEFPFQRVFPKGSEVYTACVPLLSLQGVVRRFQQRTVFEPRLDNSTIYITWDTHPAFEQGMFVALVREGASKGRYALFGPVHGAPKDGETYLLLMDSRHFGVRRYLSGVKPLLEPVLKDGPSLDMPPEVQLVSRFVSWLK